MVRVIVSDASPVNPCEGVDTAMVTLPVAHIKLALEITAPDIPQCDQEYPITVTIRNYGQGQADSVYAKVKLPVNFDFEDQADSLLFLGNMPGGMVIDTVINVRSHVIQNVPSAHPVKAQIWYAVQGDSVPTVTYGDWDWNRTPLQLDEDVDTMRVKPFFSLDDYSILGLNDTVCYLDTAYLHAVSDFTGTQYIRWYGDKALRNLLKIDTINVPGEPSEYVLESLRTVTTLYVMIESEEFCPAVLAGAVNSKLNSSETHVQIMKDGTTMVGISDKVRFYDTGGPSGNYGNNEDYTHTFTTGSGEIAMRLNSISLGSGEVFTIYDGPTATGVPLTQILSSVSSSTIYTSSTGSLTIRWHSNNSGVGNGWNADVVNTVNYATSEATAYLHNPLDIVSLEVNEACVCYGDNATLTATTDVAAPQFFTWFDEEFNMLKQDTSNNGSSDLTVYNQTRQNTYYVAVGNEEFCPATVPYYQYSTASAVLMDASANNKTTRIAADERINFYDEGGPRGDYYTTGASWYHTFTVDTGNVVMSFSQFYTESRNNDYIIFYDGESSESPIIMVNGYERMGGDLSNQLPITIESSGKNLTVYWRTDGNNSRSGWRAIVSNSDNIDYTQIVKDYDILLDSTTHNKVTIISPEDIYGFYDDGGPTGAYSNAVGNFVHTFTASQGVVQADLTNLYLQSNDHLYVYDGPEVNEDRIIADLTGSIGRRQFFSTDNSMTFKLFTHGNTSSGYSGWKMNITSNWSDALAQASVNICAPNLETSITATDAHVCFNSPAELTATSPEGVYFTWFASDGKTVVFQDTAIGHTSTYTIPNVRYDDYYYIVTTPEGSCPTIIPYQYTDKYMDLRANGEVTVISNEDYIRFYDDGGPSANYSSERVDYVHTFRGDNAGVYARFTYHYLNNYDTLFVYNGSSVNPDSLLGMFFSGNNGTAIREFASTNGSLTMRFRNNSNSYSNGWVASITTSPIIAQTVLLNPLTNNKTTYMSPIDSVLFYDDGGPSGSYTPLERTLRHTFTALQGKVRMKFASSNNGFCGNDYFYVYDGPVDHGTLLGFYTGSELNNMEFISTGNQLGIKLQTVNSSSTCNGWNATVTTVYDLPKARAEVTIEAPADLPDLHTTDDYVCYGETAQVTASSDKTVFPQYYTWYDASLNELKRDTLYSLGTSIYTKPNLTYDTFYLVSTQYADECPTLLPLRKTQILAKAGSDTLTTMVGDNDYYHFYDNGGYSGQYSTTQGDYVHTFTSENELPLYVTFSTPQHSFNTGDTLYLYDGTEMTEENLVARFTYNNGNNGPFVSTTSSFTFKFAKHGTSNYPGWHAIITEGDKIHTYDVLLNKANHNKTTVLFPSDSVRFYDEGGPNNSYFSTIDTLVHTFKAMQGEVKLKFESVNTYSYDTLYIYSGSSVDPDKLIAKYRPTALTNTVFQDTAITVRFMKRSTNTNSGWSASVTNELIPKLDTAWVAIHHPLPDVYVTATHDTVCYDGTASLFASSDIKFPQYYAWYNNDMTELLLSDTITIGSSEFNPTHQIQDSLYYVVIHNDTTCPFLPEIHFRPYRVLKEAFSFDISKHNGITSLLASDSIPFYDEGGPNGSYSTHGVNWIHTFTAEKGHVILTLTEYLPEVCCDYLNVYDGPNTSSPVLLNGSGRSLNSGDDPWTVTSTGNSLTVYWRTDGSVWNNGWKGSITTDSPDSSAVAKSTVTIHKPLADVYVTSTDDVVCYDGTASLFASSDIAFPQYYAWYNYDMTELLKRDTITSGRSEFNPTHQIHDSLYRVVVHNDTTCPYLPELYFDEIAVSVSEVTIHTPGSEVFAIATDDTVCYDGTASLFASSNIAFPQYYAWYNNDMTELLLSDTITSGRSEFNPTHQIQDSLYYVVVHNDTTCPFLPELHYHPYRILKDDFLFNSSKSGQTTIVAASDSIPFYDEGGPSGNYYNNSYWTHTFVAEKGHVVLNLSNINMQQNNDYLYVYDGANTSAPVIFTTYSKTFYNDTTITSSGDNMTVYWYTNSSTVRSGWEGSITTDKPNLVDVAEATVTIHKPLADVYVVSTDDTVCYDGTASLFASSEISFPQYYAWYNHDMTELLKLDTIFSGKSEYNPTHQIHDSLYRVVVHNDTSCPYLPELHYDVAVSVSNVRIHVPGSEVIAIATDDTVCYDGTASLFASSDMAFPQYYSWYNNDMSELLKRDTIASGRSEFNPTHQVQDSLYYVVVHNDTTCPFLPELHYHPYRILKDAFLFNSSKNGKTTKVSALDSIPFYDEGGPTSDYATHNASWTHTFTAEE